MATQHPDNARSPYWNKTGSPFVDSQKEIQDCLSSFRDLDIQEYMWDWEGKYADTSVIDKLLTGNHDYFWNHPLGLEKFLTFRIPNIWQEKGYSLLQALTVILTAEDYARDLGYQQRPLFEIILPLTERSEQLLHMHDLFIKLAKFKNELFDDGSKDNSEFIEMIPLIESIQGQQNAASLLKNYVKGYKEKYQKLPHYIRPFIACSDPALLSGWLATSLANIDSISQIHSVSQELNIPMYPIAGAGGPPFRGGLTPLTAKQFSQRLSGLRTATIQSSFRFDYSMPNIKKALEILYKELPDSKPAQMNQQQRNMLEKIIALAEAVYQQTILKILPDMQNFFNAMPKRRERRQHIGLLSYGRKMSDIKLPRAITFTGAFYAIGVPPELIGLGRTLRELDGEQKALLFKLMPHLISDIQYAGKYLNRDNLKILTKRNSAWAQIEQDIRDIEQILDIGLSPLTHSEKSHQHVSSSVLLMKNNHQSLPRLIEETSSLRNFLG